MLARLLSASLDEKIVVVPLTDVSERNRRLANNPRVVYLPQQAHTPLAFPGTVSRLAWLIRKEQPAAVVCWMYHAIVVGSIASVLSRSNSPIFWNIRQSLDDPTSLSRSTRIAIAMARHLSGIPRGIIYNSSRALELHGAYGYRNRNAIVIPNGFELPTGVCFKPKIPRVLGIAGRFHAQKDHASFFRAAALTVKTHPQTRFIAVGEGLTHNNPAVVRLLQEADLASHLVDLRGEVDDMLEFYRDIDALVLSSRTEGFPNVVAEAMCYGKPVITTDVGDAAAVVAKTGFVVPPHDTEMLAASMRKMLDLSARAYAAYARSARERIVSEYALPEIAEKYRVFLGS